MYIFFKVLLLTAILFLLDGCSYRSSDFFEDLFAENTTIKADSRFTGAIPANKEAPIISAKDNHTATTKLPSSQTLITRGKIVQANFDKDYNLYVYTFLDSITQKAVTFYYDKNIAYNKNTRFKIVVRGNYLQKIEKVNNGINAASKSKKINHPVRKPRKYKKRRRSFIKVPIVEKINTL